MNNKEEKRRLMSSWVGQWQQSGRIQVAFVRANAGYTGHIVPLIPE